MKKRKDSKMAKQELIDSLRLRIRSLQNARQHYQQNPNSMSNVRIMNIDLIQNDIELLKKTLSILTKNTIPEEIIH